jgi:ArsR family transcriptional regulator
MNAKLRAKYDARAKIMKALAHPARLLIVDTLASQGERCVCDLTEIVGSDMSTVSRHLAQLKSAGIIQDEKRGQMVFYRLRVKCLTGLFNCIESVVKCNANHQLNVLAI